MIQKLYIKYLNESHQGGHFRHLMCCNINPFQGQTKAGSLVPGFYYNLSQKQSKCPWRRCEMVQNAHILRVCSAFSLFRAPGGGISQSSTCALNSNLIFEIGSY